MIIGVSGRKRSGKDTFAKRLIEAHGFRRESFADPLRDMAYALNPLVDDVGRLAGVVDAIGWERAKDEHPEIRRLLQRLGTEAGRKVLGKNIWVDTAMRKTADGELVVFTDCRFTNEADAIRERGGHIVRIERPGLADGDAHPSETSLDDYAFDFIVYNDGGLEKLGQAADWVLGRV